MTVTPTIKLTDLLGHAHQLVRIENLELRRAVDDRSSVIAMVGTADRSYERGVVFTGSDLYEMDRVRQVLRKAKESDPFSFSVEGVPSVAKRGDVTVAYFAVHSLDTL